MGNNEAPWSPDGRYLAFPPPEPGLAHLDEHRDGVHQNRLPKAAAATPIQPGLHPPVSNL